MATNTNNGPRPEGRGEAASKPRHASPPRPPRARKPVFDKEHATLCLLTLSLGLGVGAIVRVAQSGNATTAGAPTSQLAVQRAQLPGYGTAGSSSVNANQRVLVLPQRSYRARGTTRMS